MKRLPLEGVRVVDLTMMWAGPYATHLLGEMGAEVIKVEGPRAWDNVRTLFPIPEPEPWDASFYFNDYNREKKSLVLDLTHPRGRELLLELVAKSDAVIENYRADVLDRLGLGWDALQRARSDIILVSMAGFGKTGADRELVGFGPIVEQMAGLASLTGYGDDGVPYKTGISYGDPVGGVAAAGALVLALIHRRRTGRGSSIDLAQREVMAQMLGEAFVAASLRGEAPVHRGNRHAVWAPQGVYPCQGEQQWLALSVRSDDEWQALCDVLGSPELVTLSAEERRERHDEIDARIAAWAQAQEAQPAQDTLQERGIPAARMLDSDSVHWDGHLLARDYWDFMKHPRMQPYPQPAPPWRFVEANPRPRRPAPMFGEHNREILCDLLGVSEAELAELTAAGVIAESPVGAGVG